MQSIALSKQFSERRRKSNGSAMNSGSGFARRRGSKFYLVTRAPRKRTRASRLLMLSSSINYELRSKFPVHRLGENGAVRQLDGPFNRSTRRDRQHCIGARA